jgi:hypothetical protein
MPGYTPRFLAAVRRAYENTDEPMPSIAFHYDISLRTLHRMVERGAWRKRADRPPKDLTPADLLYQASQAMLQGQAATARALLNEFQERQRLRDGKLPR